MPNDFDQFDDPKTWGAQPLPTRGGNQPPSGYVIDKPKGQSPKREMSDAEVGIGPTPPKFDPSKPYEDVPRFDPSKPYEELPDAPWAVESVRPLTDAEVGLKPTGFEDLIPPKYSAPEAATEGALAGASANWRDEIFGASEASGLPRVLGGFRAPIGAARLAWDHYTGQPGPASAEYDRALNEIHARQQAMQAQHPTAYGIGEVGGAGASLLLAPEAKAATLGARALQAGKVGAAYGAISGAGEGNDALDRIENSAAGAALGAAGAAAAVPVGAALSGAARRTYDAITGPVRGLLDPEKEAAARVLRSLRADAPQIEAGRALGMTPTGYAAATQAGDPTMLMDVGGAHTKALLRSAANVSPEARNILESATNDRFVSQSGRAANTIRNLVTGGANAAKTRAQLEAEYESERGFAYKTAYAAGDTPINSPELERLMGSRSVTAAMKDAAEHGNDRAIAEGHGGFNAAVETTPDGRVTFRPGPNGVPTYPNLQFWDSAYRSLRDSASAAFRAGRNSEGSSLGALANSLRSELDRLVPPYAKARGVASQFFGAEDALDAGAKAVNYKGNLGPLKQTLARMGPAEREMFQEAYADTLASRVEAMSDRTDVTNRLFNSPQDRAKIDAVFGQSGTRALEAYIRRESIFDYARKALGNSTTVRQMIEAGLAGGAVGSYFGGTHGALEGAALGALGGSHSKFGAARAVARQAVGYVDRNVAKRVAELLTSNDPSQLQKGLQQAAAAQRVSEGLRAIENRLATLAGSQAPRKQRGNLVPVGNTQNAFDLYASGEDRGYDC
jgi:hypothetical protein